MKPVRHSVDLSAYPDLVVIYLGLRVNAVRGIASLMGIGRGLGPAIAARPDGLLAHATMFYSLRHIGFRQYWRNMDTMLVFTRSEPHRSW